MAAVSAAAIRLAVATRLDALSGLRLSEAPYEGIRAVTRSPVHLEFAVGVPVTEPLSDGRQRIANGCEARTELRVVVAWKLADKDRPTDSDTALATEAAIRNDMLARWYDSASFRWERSERQAGIDGWLWLEQTFTATHTLPLS
jgi:hypothetical protein